MEQIPVRYVGLQAQTTDHLYGSGVVFKRGKVSKVPDWAAARLLKHSEFEDARPEGVRGTPILAERVFTLEEVDREREELDAQATHVNLTTMTREQMSAYSMRHFGVRVDPTALKADVTTKVMGLMRQKGVG